MKNIKSFLSGINNMLIFLFKLDLTKWRVLFDNKYIRINAFTTSSCSYLIPVLELFLDKEFGFFSGYKYRLFITFKLHKFIVHISFDNY